MADRGGKVADRAKALARAERTLGPWHPTTISARWLLAQAYDDATLPERAQPLLERVVQDLDRTIGPAHERTLLARKNLADVSYRAMRVADALSLYQYTAGQAAALLGPLHACTVLARSGVAKCLLEMGLFGEAIAEYDRLLPDSAAGFGPSDAGHLQDRYRLATAWDGIGRQQEALAQYWRLMSDCERLLGPAAPLTRCLAGNLVPAPRPWRAAGPLGAHRLWLVALSAILGARSHGSSPGTLYPSPWLHRHDSAAELVPDWGITSRDLLLSKLEWLSASGHRASLAARLGHPPMAWDFARYSWVVRRGFAAEYIDEAEAWQLLEPVAGQVAGCYGSWRDYADDYLAARLAWRSDTDEPGAYGASQQRTTAAVNALLDPANARSPWNLAPWDAISRPDQPVTAIPPPSDGRDAPDRSR